jgi:hypothetical protein
MSLRALSAYNRVLISAMDILIKDVVDLRVFHISGVDNIIADCLSGFHNKLTLKLAPNLTLSSFIPPRDVLEVPKK